MGACTEAAEPRKPSISEGLVHSLPTAQSMVPYSVCLNPFPLGLQNKTTQLCTNFCVYIFMYMGISVSGSKRPMPGAVPQTS